ncbi:glycoside hydrolase family 66 protein [Cohnella caldifontis]|uniref:glycoside hydrolase family 66 protein n=1 Tax=Cohnella caldifontis TaxID=3027471 RepID=UPI0023ECB038|nr:glycoside hydrolase family 66 protein [Cohnella sp. YIM B05605]
MNDTLSLRLLPRKAQFRPGEAVRILVELPDADDGEEGASECIRFRWQVQAWDRIVLQGVGALAREEEGEPIRAEISLPGFAGSGAYGVFAQTEGIAPIAGETAFDVAAHWREAPRYGFLSDFAPGDRDSADADFLLRCHLNVVQFYDWMYRHDRLLTDEDPFTDPLGRTISFAAVRGKIAALQERGIASLAYAAVYASLPDYASEHPEQLLYRNDGTPYSLGNYFFIMDISPGSAWTERVTDEFRSAVEWGFDGLHLDQYGFPKRALRKTEDGGFEAVRLRDLYPALINRTREKLSEAGLIFNNVGTYPVHATAEASQDAVYIEVWDPVTRLQDLYALVRRTRALTRKPIILAAYLPAFHPEHPADPEQAETGALFAMAAICASGAYHLLLGENGGVLADPYYPKYGQASPAFRERLIRHADFIVMYRDLLFDPAMDDWTEAFTGGINNELTFAAADGHIRFSTEARTGTVWTIAKEKPDAYVIHLVNLVGLDNDDWHAPKASRPKSLGGIEATVEVVEEIEGIYAASPDGESIAPIPLGWEWVRKGEDGGRFARFTLPRLDVWTVVFIRLRAGSAAS